MLLYVYNKPQSLTHKSDSTFNKNEYILPASTFNKTETIQFDNIHCALDMKLITLLSLAVVIVQNLLI